MDCACIAKRNVCVRCQGERLIGQYLYRFIELTEGEEVAAELLRRAVEGMSAEQLSPKTHIAGGMRWGRCSGLWRRRGRRG